MLLGAALATVAINGNIMAVIKDMGAIRFTIVILGQIPFINTEIYQGVLSQQMNDLDIAWITGSISAFILYVISIKIKNKRFQPQKVSI